VIMPSESQLDDKGISVWSSSVTGTERLIKHPQLALHSNDTN
jgi:hypothetical protein